nr:MAG TPA: hypothetical protein [Caudoviricetes sp.]
MWRVDSLPVISTSPLSDAASPSSSPVPPSFSAKY